MGLAKSVLQYMGVLAVTPPDLTIASRAPTSADKKYQPGSLWLDKVAVASYQYPGSGNWIALGGAVVAIATINSQAPVAGNYVLAGTASQITATNTAGTTTFSLPAAIIAPGSLTTTTSITATAGDITATLGNVIINGAAKQLRVHGGAATDFIGTGTLVNGTVTISNTNIAATDRIFLQRIGAAASTTLGELSYTISAATSFTVTSLILGTPASTQTADVSTFAYFIVRQV